VEAARVPFLKIFSFFLTKNKGCEGGGGSIGGNADTGEA